MCQRNLLCQFPNNVRRSNDGNLDKEIIRASIINELNAINFFERLTALTENKAIIQILKNAANMKKEYIESLQALLAKYDAGQAEEEIKKNKKAESQSLWNMC